MRLRNKKTGKIVEWENPLQYKLDKEYYSIKDFVEEWEDAPEEPKEYWYISAYGNLAKTDVMTDLHRGAEEIGNLFETKEEAELAVRKLKAWKRLKDKGFRFKTWGWENKDRYSDYCIWFTLDNNEDTVKDLDLLFGGEE